MVNINNSMTRQQIIDSITNTIYPPKLHDGYLISKWVNFRKENLKLLKSIQSIEIKHLEIDEKKCKWRLKRKV